MKNTPEIHLANLVYLRRFSGVSDTHLDLLRTSFDSINKDDYKQRLNKDMTDFDTPTSICNEINTAVQRLTQSHIKTLNVVPSIHTRILLLNAIHFKGVYLPISVSTSP